MPDAFYLMKYIKSARIISQNEIAADLSYPAEVTGGQEGFCVTSADGSKVRFAAAADNNGENDEFYGKLAEGHATAFLLTFDAPLDPSEAYRVGKAGYEGTDAAIDPSYGAMASVRDLVNSISESPNDADSAADETHVAKAAVTEAPVSETPVAESEARLIPIKKIYFEPDQKEAKPPAKKPRARKVAAIAAIISASAAAAVYAAAKLHRKRPGK